MKTEPFAPEHDAIIAEVYPKFGSPGVLNILKQYNRQQICSRAYQLGITRDKDWQKRLANLRQNEIRDAMEDPQGIRARDIYPDAVKRLAYAGRWV